MSGLVRSNAMENYFTLSEAAAHLGVSHEAVRRLCHRGTLAHVRKSGRLFVKRVDVERRRAELDEASPRRSA